MKRKKIKYLRNNPAAGAVYDWHEIRQGLKALGIPATYYNPSTAPLEKAQWFVELSERATGKTTGWLLLGMVMFQLYGTVTMYVRQTRDMVAPKNASSLFNVICDNDYISKLTDDEYNNVYYRSKKWYFCKIDPDTGEMTAKHPDYFCRMVSLDEATNLKSACNEPMGDLIIFDEFIGKYTPTNEFVTFVDVCSTILRLRETGKIILLANTIDKYNQYFHDLEIFERIATMDISESCLHTTDKGTNIYIEMIGAPKVYRTKKAKWVRLFAGFKKPELASITGEATWAVKCYPHIPDIEEDAEAPETLFRNIYIYYNNKLIRLDIVSHPELGLCIYTHWATNTHPDSIILTNEPRFDSRYQYGIPSDTTAGKFILNMLLHNRVYYSANDVGAFLESYLYACGVSTRYIY